VPEADPFARRVLRDAVATPSPSGQEGRLAARLADAFRERVDAVAIDEVGNLRLRHGDGPTRLLFLGHLDTVPGEVPVEEREGALYGRGAVDAKGPLCAALVAVARASEAARAALTMEVVGAVGEEAPGSVGARHLLASSPRPDLLIVCEPSGWERVTLGYKGHLRLRIGSERPSGHAAGPEPSAADRVVEAAAAFRAACAALDGEAQEGRAFDAVQATVLDLRHEHDGLRERAEATLGVRLPPAWPARRLLERLGGAWRSDAVSVEVVEAVDAVRGPRDGPLPRAFRSAVRAAGGRPGSVVKTGTSDWNVVAERWSVPALAYGPGDAALDHTPDEHLDLASYDASIAVLVSVLDRLAASRAAGPA
jgi:LysW-gamma-L-lysine carboxypeptidase